jgi:hypothetical protein
MATNGEGAERESLVAALSHLRWGDGLTREEMRNQSSALRHHRLDCLPPDFRFSDPGSVLSYLDRIEAEGPIDVSTFPPPGGYGDRAPTGLTVPVHRTPPSVGSGAGSGNTGSEAQTGVGRGGTEESDPSELQP